jgi:PAS domain S-box-containing protein
MGAIVVIQHRNRITLQAEIDRRRDAEEELRQQYIEIQKARYALKLSERRLTDIINFLPDATFAIDREGRVIAWNRAMEEMTGVSAADMLGRGNYEYALPFYGARRRILIDMIYEDPDVIRSQYVNVQRNGNILVGEAFYPRMHRGRGAHLWGITSPLYDNDGNIVGAIESLRDITNRKMAEDALNRATKKLSFLSSITFSDIQNAVFSLSGYLELEKSALVEGRATQYLDKQIGIVRTITESLKFADNFQSLGQKPPAWQNVRQSFLIGISHLDVTKLSRILAVDDLEIYADPLLEQVFFTLAENVVLHGKSATKIMVRYQESQEGLTLIFEDDGVGIPYDMKERIFNRQFETNAGMGLFLAREILSITGIMIKENGEPGKGARFEISIPGTGFRFGEKPQEPAGGGKEYPLFCA